MARRPSFEFDISVGADKKRRSRGRRGMSGEFETSTRPCEHEGCTRPGRYRAPKSPDNLEEYHWFCLEHVRAFNAQWNYFETKTEAEAEAEMDKARVWDRETQPLKNGDQKAWQRFGVNDPMEVLGENATLNPGEGARARQRRLPPTERKALTILGAEDTMTKSEIRKCYKSMIKDLHPDMNGGSREDEERLQEVVWAWDQIKGSRSFRD